MSRLIRTAGDALLHRLIPQVAAGACVPEHNQICCSCCAVGGTFYCFRYNCQGACVASSTTCC